MIIKKLAVLLSVLGVGFMPAIAMKRIGDELITSPAKRHEGFDVDTDLCKSIEKYNFSEFEKAVHLGADINKKYDGGHLFYTILDNIDFLREKNLNFAMNSFQHQAVMDKNDIAIEELHKCLKLMLKHYTFDIKKCIGSCGEFPLQFLIQRNCDSMYTHEEEETLKSKDESFILIDLLKAGASVNERNNGFTPLHLVALQDENEINLLSTERNLKMAETLIQYGANINATTPEGDTPLHLCSNDVRMIPLLLAHGARFNQTNVEGKTPADLSQNSWVREYILKDELVVENCKNDIARKVKNIVFSDILSMKKQENISQLLARRQVEHVSLHQTNHLYPYTQAVIKSTEDVTVHQMIEDMGYVFVSDEESESM